MIDEVDPASARRRHVAAAILLALAVVLGLAAAMEWSVGVRAERVSDLVRPELTDAGLASHRHDFEATKAALFALRDDVLPAIARSAGLLPDQLESEVSENYPATGKLLQEIDEIVPFAEQGVANLERNQDEFRNADAFPIAGLPSYSLAILDLGLTLVLAIAGIMLWRDAGASGRKLAISATFAVAVVLVIVPVALGIPAKTRDAQAVLDSLNPAPAVVTRTEAALATAEEGFTEFQEELLPDLATALGTTPATLEATIVTEFPETADALNDTPGIMSRYEERVAIRTNGAPEIRKLKDVPVRELGWFGPVFGAVVAAAAGLAVVLSKPSTRDRAAKN